jgi:hypothetical protein
MKKLLFLPLVALIAAGCASSPLGLGVGTGISTGRVYAAGQKAVLDADRTAAPDCQDRKVTNTEVVSAPTVTATPYDQAYTHSLPDSSKATSSPSVPLRRSETTHSEYTERWTVSRCGERAKYLVTFRPNGEIKVVADK